MKGKLHTNSKSPRWRVFDLHQPTLYSPVLPQGIHGWYILQSDSG